jgi:outer membrane autotransporter protein
VLALVAGVAMLAPERALANCRPTTTPATGQRVICDLLPPNPFTTPIVAQPGATNVTVQLATGVGGAQLVVNGTAITLGGGGSISVTRLALVQGTTAIADTSAVVVDSYGNITGTTGPAIVLNAPGDSKVFNQGAIAGNGTAVQLNSAAGSTLTLSNSGIGATINGDVIGSGDGKIVITQKANFNGGVTIDGSGVNVITSGAGKDFSGLVSVTGAQNTIDNGGTLRSGLVLNATQSNTITNESGASINRTMNVSGDTNQITNLGTISAGLTVTGTTSNTIENRAGAVIDNTFLVAGPANNTIINAGRISTTLQVHGTGSVFDSGTISTLLGNAIEFSADPGPHTLTLAPGFVINGAVVGSGNDTLQLGGVGSERFNVSDIATPLLTRQQYQGFSVFNKVDPSTWTLTGSGAQNWNIEAGTLIGDTDSLQGSAITDNAVLVFDQRLPGTYAGSISGTGSVTVQGGTAFTFTGANSYTGSTTIALGNSLTLGNGGTSGSLAGDVANAGALVFNRSDTAAVNGAISGIGSVFQLGTGTTVLAAQNSYRGVTDIDAGTLDVKGAIASSLLTTVASGATLSGTGTLGTTIISGGGTLLPGNGAIGALTVSGNLTFRSGASYVVAVSPDAASAVNVTGAATVAGTLTAVAVGGPFTTNEIVPVVISTGGVSGSFSLATSGDFGGATLSVLTGANDVFLKVIGSPTGPPIWKAAPSSSDWNTGANWSSGTVPLATDIAQFGATTISTVTISQPTEVGGLAFDNTAPNYTINIQGNGTAPASLTMIGSGIADLTTAHAPQLNVGGTATAPGSLIFESAGAAGDATITANAFGTTLFFGTSTAGDARLVANAGGNIDFSGVGSAPFAAASIEGAGTFELGSGAFTVGANNLSTTVSGTIGDGGVRGGFGAGLTKVGSGTLTLSGNNSYTGGTLIANGTLQLGDGGASGSVAGNIVDGASLAINRSDSFDFNGVISGGGSVVLSGSGTTVLTAHNTYSGATTVADGTLIVHGALDGTSGVSVGDGGTAALTINEGGAVNTGSSVLGDAAGTTGTAVIADPASVWNSIGSLTIGGAGSGTLTIQDRASVTAASITIASQPGSTGTLNIGAPAGAAPTGPGTIDPPAITFGSGNGSLVFNHDQMGLIFDVALAGPGTIAHDGPGITILSADSSGFSGSTAVNAGTLAVTGTLGSATSAISVNTGGTLTGTGTIGGAVSVGDGGTLAGTEGDTLVLGSLSLSSGSHLAVALGRPGTTALFHVNGNLTLDGTLDIADLGGFEGGIYRLIDYGGTLTDNGLAFGQLPPGTTAATLAIQTSIANEVNLVNSAGVSLRFWDGVGPPDDGVVQGGNGTWDASNRNWTTQDGTINGPWSTDFAIFDASPGTVLIDPSFGPIAVTGMQFAVDGYQLTGDPIALANPVTIIRVGDGTPSGAGFTATIDDVLSGNSLLVKSDQGTLVLGGDNAYSGGTIVEAGTLVISEDDNLGAAAGPLSFQNGTLQTTADIASTRAVAIIQSATFDVDAATVLELAGAITGQGDLTKTGDGVLVLTGQDAANGLTTISTGTLMLGNGGTTGNLAGDIEDDSVFAVNRVDDVVLGGVITGSGSVAQVGPGTTIFTADNHYLGGTTISDGTLQLGNGGTSGAIEGAVADNGTLSVDRSDTAEIPVQISGSGAFVQMGSGTTVLSGANTYSAGTTISGGTLQVGDGNTSGSITGDVSDNATLAFARADDVTFPGTVTGTGSLVQAGAGTLTLSAANDYSGGTTIASGVLALGNGGTSGSIEGAVTDNAVLAVDRSDTFDLANAISGTGSFVQIGTGTTILSAASTYSGVTAVESGQLTVHGSLTGTSDIIVGDFSQAALVIENGGTVSGVDAVLGRLPGSSGSVLVSGANSLWTTTGTLEIGADGAGTLTIADGAHVDAATVAIAENAGSAGTLNIGAPAGAPAGIPGFLDPPTLTFGPGTGRLVFNHTDPAYIFDAAIGGTGSIEQDGPGTTILTANSNTFSGLTSINAGTLRVTGVLGGAVSAAEVGSGSTLTGTGTVGGVVVVDSGGTLSGIEGQTLTLGSLTLASGSHLGVTLGAPGATALFSVNGPLTLGGTLDITDLGGFSSGVYRLIDYTGALTDNGIAFGTLPPGTSASDLSVQTSVANQVNLVNTSGKTLQFWDGQGPADDGVIQGGNGIWNATNRSWTDSAGAVNGSWSTDFAVFETAPGTVTVDTSQGAISATGMQFAVDGYHLTGDPIALSGTAPVIRVGDGTAAGASFTATIDNVLSGTGALVKTDLGRLVLAGANTYSGGTLIAAGTLSISSDANLGAAVGALGFVDGTLETTANIVSGRAITIARSATFEPNAGSSLELDGAISGPGDLTMNSPGTLVIAGADSASGETTIAAGTLVLGNGGTSGSIAGGVVDNSTFAVNRSDSLVLGGVITGSGSFAQLGTGTTIFSADNDYAGGTTIQQGALQLGSGGAAGSIIGAITDNGTLAIDRSDVFTLDNAISGTGGLAQIGPGTTILIANDTYSGGTTIAAGTLQIGDGNMSGAIAGDVTDNAALVFDRADTVTFGGAASGSGTLTQAGAGTLILTGTSTYGGGTTIVQGALQLGNGGASGSIEGPVVDNGSFAIDRSDAFTFGGAISGSGGFSQLGSGVTTLSGISTYAGPTRVASGELVVPGSLSGTRSVLVGDTGTAALAIENGGIVSDNNAVLGALPGASGTATVSGANSLWSTAGRLIVGAAGNGSLEVSGGANVIAGDIVVAEFAGSHGAIEIGGLPGATALAAGFIDPPTITFGAGSGSLVFNHTNPAYVFSAPFAGSGTIVQDGPGATILTADSSAFTGTTTVNAGRLEVDGVLGGPSSVLNVLGGTLAGTGAAGGVLSVADGATLAPGGAGIGTLTVGGNLTFAPGSIYRIGLTPAAADLTSVGGTASIAGGVHVIAAPGMYPANATYPILTATGGVSGTFDSLVTISSVFLSPSLSYSANEVDLVLTTKTFPSVAETPNQVAISDAIQSLGPANPVFDAVFNLESDAEARKAFDALSGEIHASTVGVMIQDTRYVREAVLARLRGSLDEPSESVDIPMNDPPHNVWLQGIAAVGGADSDGNAANLDRSITGVIGGFDESFDEIWQAGIAAAYTHALAHQDVRASRASSGDVTVALYGSGQFDALGVRLGAAYGWHDIDTRRAVAFTGFADTDSAHYHDRDAQVFGEIGYAVREGDVALEPFGDITYVHLDTDAFAEKGGAAALTAGSQSLDTTFTTLGARASSAVGDIAGAPVHLDLTLGWVHAFGDVVPATTLAFASGGVPFTVFGTPLARDSALLETGLDVDVSPTAKVSFLYSGELAPHARDNSFKATLVWNF